MTTRRIAQTKASKTATPQPTNDEGSTATPPTGESSTDNPPPSGDQSDSATGSGSAAFDASGGDGTASAGIVTDPVVGRDETHAEFTAEGGVPTVKIQEAGSQVFSAIDVGSLLEPLPVVLNLDAAVVDVLVDVLIVTGPANGGRRAGLRFGPEPTILPLAILRQDEIASIEDDRRLTTRRDQRAASDI